MLKQLRLTAIFCLAIFLFISCNKRSGKPKVLVFSKTSGYRHASIPEGKKAIIKLGLENGFDVDTTENAEYFTEDSLSKYSAVIFLSTTGDVLNNYQEADFERYIQAGGGYLGVHAATDCEYDWGWYGRMAGGYFLSHPEQQEATLQVVDQTDNSTKHLPKEWKRKDEWYNFKKLNKDVHVLIKIDEKSYTGGKNGDDHPMAWRHDFDGGRAFYTELGHTNESFADNNYLKHLLGGIQYAIGDNKKLNYGKSTTLRVPEEDRFTKTSLVKGTFYEPTEMTVLPNLDILVAQRRGELMLYKNADKSIQQVGFLPVYFKTLVNTKVNAEEGMLGLKADPNFEKNHFIYIFYSPKDTSVNRLSRFKFENNALDLASEKIILQFYSQREICCHTGGSIDFAGDGKTLFLSTGDNSTPFDEPNQGFVNHGFAPLNDEPGHEQYDARRSSGNTNDLRGKILRITMNEDGTYSIPEGNLFPKGTEKARPEIYVMGDRNPYRIMVDKKNSFLYWGEVGPDANSDSLDTRGSRGYDEVNQARKAGYFGWPLFVGNNYPYRAYDYATGASGQAFDPAKPINNSRNNTGLKELPPAQPAFIWYPYANSPDFPQVGTGGRNAMAGPVYYTDMYPKETRLPDYYNNKLFIYDWIRGWIKVVTMQPNGDFDKMEPFIGNTKLANLIDMEVGPDGKLYFLEYGTGWFSKNPDAGLSRIDYNSGNRPAKLTNLQVNKRSGVLPLALEASIDAKDPENDKLTYIWDLGNGIKKETTSPSLSYSIDKAGEYNVSVEVIDDKKASAKSDVISVYAGNEAPSVSIALTGNKTFYFPGKQVLYNVSVKDNDDSTAGKDGNGLVVSADYIEGRDRAGASMGHQVLTEATIGKNMMLTLDCKTCHKEADKSIGPSFTDVAKKYKDDPNAVPYLVNKVIKGGSGVWGDVAMAAHPNLSEGDARQIITWVQSLADDKKLKSLPASGKLNATLDKPLSDRGMLYVSASYTDKGSNGVKPLSDQAIASLRNNKISLGIANNLKEYQKRTVNGRRLLTVPAKEGSFSIDSIDLSLIKKASLIVEWQKPSLGGYTFELYLDSPTGQKLASFDLPGGGKEADAKTLVIAKTITAAIATVNDGKLHNIYIVSRPKDPKETSQISLSFFQLDL